MLTDVDRIDRSVLELLADKPSDHIIISHAITERLPLISSDLKFPFYRKQGLDLIEY
jgi:PIN domain nuclease of toxin-antitoxin system